MTPKVPVIEWLAILRELERMGKHAVGPGAKYTRQDVAEAERRIRQRARRR